MFVLDGDLLLRCQYQILIHTSTSTVPSSGSLWETTAKGQPGVIGKIY